MEAPAGRAGADRDTRRRAPIADLGNVDIPNRRFRVASRYAKTRKARWVQVPTWLLDLIEETCPQEDRVEGRRVFPNLNDSSFKGAIARACKQAGAVHHPHDLRHRRLSLWHGRCVPASELAARAWHSRTSMTLDVYSHVMPLDEVPAKALRSKMVMHQAERARQTHLYRGMPYSRIKP